MLCRIVTSFALSCVLLVMQGASVAQAHDDAVSSILAANKQATGAEAVTGTITHRYTYAAQGLTGTTESMFDAANGRYVKRYDLPPLSGASGFDGEVAWMTDLSGASTPQAGGDRPALGVNAAYRYANLWWRPDFGGARIEKLGRDEEGDRLRIVPQGGKAFEAWFDVANHHLVRVREVRGFTTIDVRYRDFERHTDAMLPRTTLIENGRGPAGRRTLTLVDTAIAPERPARDFAMPSKLPDDWSITGGASETVLPMRLLNNHIFVDVRVDGKGPFPFLVDTGGHDILTPSTVAALGLKAQGAATTAGAGEKTQIAGYTKVSVLEMGAARMTNQTVMTLDFSPKDVEGLQVGGMLGFEVFQRFVVRIDYGANTLTLIDPHRFQARDAGRPLPFVFYDHLPQIAGRFAGIPGRFDIDTGSRAEVTLTTPYVEANRLRQRFPHGLVTVDGWGVGGPVRSHVVRAPSLELGKVSVADVTASLGTQTKGVFTDANFEGNVGSGFLKRFVVTFDYMRRTMYLKPLRQLSADTGTFDRSGMWINLASDGYEVMEVAPDGPAAQTGMAVGDLILELNGHTPSDMVLADARRLLRAAPAGSRIAITMRRDKVIRKTALVLRDQIPPRAVPLPP